MCMRYSENSKKICIFGCGTFFVLLAISVGFLWPIIANNFLQKELELKKGSFNYENWIETPIPMYLRFTMFHWTNPHEIYNKSSKPHFIEMGPYVFLEKHKRVNVTFDSNKDTVSFDQIRTWHFLPEMSNGTLDDSVTNINVIAASTAFSLRFSNPIIKWAANRALKLLKEDVVITKTVRELLFDGYEDRLLSWAKRFPIPGIKVPPFNKFGWFVDRNLSYTYDGHFEMYSGHSNLARMGTLTKWNYVNRTSFYNGPCGDVNGTSAELWPTNINATGDITLFVPDLCRPITLSYQQKHTRFGVTGSRWVGDYRVFDNGKNYPPNKCFCTGPQSSCPDLLPGVHNMSDCRYGAPVFASFPHFYLADSDYVNAIDGLKPDEDKHEFSISLEPITGIPLEVDAKIQINIHLQPIDGFSVYKNVPSVMIPAFWFAQTVELNEKLAKDAKIALQLPSIGTYVAFGVSGLGLILLIVGTILTLTKSWNNYQNLDDELSQTPSTS